MVDETTKSEAVEKAPERHITGSLLNTPTPSQINVLCAAASREAGGEWSIQRSIRLDCIEHGWLTEDYYLTDLGKKILNTLSR